VACTTVTNDAPPDVTSSAVPQRVKMQLTRDRTYVPSEFQGPPAVAIIGTINSRDVRKSDQQVRRAGFGEGQGVLRRTGRRFRPSDRLL
jgi:hypothetical protein